MSNPDSRYVWARLELVQVTATDAVAAPSKPTRVPEEMHTIASLRPARGADRAFVERVYFETQRWIIEALFGWRGDEVEKAKFADFYDEANSVIVVVDKRDVGWMTVVQHSDYPELESIYLETARQGRGIGTVIIQALMREAARGAREIRLSTALLNPARNLYTRLGFTAVRQDKYKVYMIWSGRKTT